jgi:hypothetical protein
MRARMLWKKMPRVVLLSSGETSLILQPYAAVFCIA